MKKTVDEKAVILATFQKRSEELMKELESMGAIVFERMMQKEVTLLILCEPTAIVPVTELIAPLQDRSWDPFSVEIRDMFATTPEPDTEASE